MDDEKLYNILDEDDDLTDAERREIYFAEQDKQDMEDEWQDEYDRRF